MGLKKEPEQIEDGTTPEDRKSFRNAVIIYAIIEALVLIPILLYLILR
jgi:hypothetical protein